MKQIEFEVSEDGSVKIKTKGFQGEACMKEVEKVLAELKKAGIDASTDKVEKTPEYYAAGTKQNVSA